MEQENKELRKAELEARRSQILQRLEELKTQIPPLHEHGPDDSTFQERQVLEQELAQIEKQLPHL